MAKKLYEETNIQDIANALREATGTETKYKPSEMGDATREFVNGLIDTANATTGNTDTDLTTAVGSLVSGYGQGESGSNPLEYAVRLDSMFNSVTFPENHKIVLDTNNVISYQFAFYATKNLKKATLINRNEVSAVNLYQMFNSSEVEVIDLSGIDTTKVTNTTNMFYACFYLREIIGKIAFPIGVMTGSEFYADKALVEVRFKEGTISCTSMFNLSQSPLLSDTSTQSIIDGLADLTGETSQKLTLHATVKAKLTEEQIATITSKNWTLA